MKKRGLTRNQKEILSFIITVKSKKRGAPTLKEIQAHFKFKAIGSVQDYINVLQEKGYIRRTSKARDIEILDNAGIEVPDRNIVKIPIVGRVAAGTPILAEENLEGHLRLDRSLVKAKNAFLLKVQGESMINAHIQDGDMVLVHPGETCNSGEIVVCMIEDEATVKRFYKRQNHIELKPENDRFEPIIVKPTNKFSVVGKVCGVIRTKV